MNAVRRYRVWPTPLAAVQSIRCWMRTKGRRGTIIAARARLRFEEDAAFVVGPTGWLIIGAGHFYSSSALPARLDMAQGSLFTVSGKVAISAGCSITLWQGAQLFVGDGTYLNPNCVLTVAQGIHIGSGCAIGWGVNILDNDHHRLGNERWIAPVTIGDRVWIGAEAMILKGVTVGSGAVVAARSVVTHDVPAKALIAGNPARVLRENIDWTVEPEDKLSRGVQQRP